MVASSSQRSAPGPRGHVLLGNAPGFQRDIMRTLLEGWRAHGDVVRFRGIGPLFPVYLVVHPDAVQHVLQKNHRNYLKTPYVDDKWRMVVGDGLICSVGDFWRRQRRLIQPAFHRPRIADLADLMSGVTAEMFARWDAVADSGRPLDMKTEMTELTLNVLAQALFSADWSREAKAMGPAVSVAIRHAYHQLESFVSLPERIPTPANRRFVAARRTLDQIVYRLIAERRRATTQSNDMLEMLIQAHDPETGEQMSDQQVRNEVMTFIFGGHETVSSGLTWTFYLLSKHPQIARRVQQEVDQVLQGRAPTADDLLHMPYLTQVVQEVMRLYPPVWLTSRTPLADDEIGGYHIPAGAMVLICSYVTHRHPQYWDNADAFDPERFRPEQVQERPRHAYLPFSNGPRKCIGDYFGMLETEIVVAMMAQRYRLDLVPGHPVVPQPGITLRQQYGLPMTIHRRQPPVARTHALPQIAHVDAAQCPFHTLHAAAETAT